MIQDFFFEYPGFHRIKSRCHIRIVSEPTKPVVIICSQIPGNTGTSVQNAYEVIKASVLDDLGKGKEKRVKIASVLDEFADTLEKTKKFRVAIALFLLRQSAKGLRDEGTALDIFGKRNEDIIWIEHWPKGTGLLDKESDYYLVEEDEKGFPSWKRILDMEKFTEKLGYPVSHIEKDESIFHE
ncbi:hypothetical protein [Alcanivorax sp.]|uniref:hypothetical protein n=1 Tax=Alcanivorax sp. TaxID=1872427 RepID=UPI00258CF1BC|nr:hypothetical protein [Alcanivorax sp.]